MKVPNVDGLCHKPDVSLSRLQNEGSQQIPRHEQSETKSIKATE